MNTGATNTKTSKPKDMTYTNLPERATVAVSRSSQRKLIVSCRIGVSRPWSRRRAVPVDILLSVINVTVKGINDSLESTMYRCDQVLPLIKCIQTLSCHSWYLSSRQKQLRSRDRPVILSLRQSCRQPGKSTASYPASPADDFLLQREWSANTGAKRTR